MMLHEMLIEPWQYKLEHGHMFKCLFAVAKACYPHLNPHQLKKVQHNTWPLDLPFFVFAGQNVAILGNGAFAVENVRGPLVSASHWRIVCLYLVLLNSHKNRFDTYSIYNIYIIIYIYILICMATMMDL